MVKNMKTAYVILILCLTIGCRSHTNNERNLTEEEELLEKHGFKIPDGKDGERADEYFFHYASPSMYAKYRVAVYELKEEYFTLMDSMVCESINKSRNKNRKLGFSFWASKFDNNMYQLHILPIEYRTVCRVKESLFYYNGFQFNIDGDFVSDMFNFRDSMSIWRLDPQWWDYLTDSDDLGGSCYLLND